MVRSRAQTIRFARNQHKRLRQALATDDRELFCNRVSFLWLCLKVQQPSVPLYAVNLTESQLARLMRRCGQYLRERIMTGTDHEALSQMWLLVDCFDRSPTWEMLGTTKDEFLGWVRDYAQRYYALMCNESRLERAITILELPGYYEADLDEILEPGALVRLARTALDVVRAEIQSFATDVSLDRRTVMHRIIELCGFLSVRILILYHAAENPEDDYQAYNVYALEELEELQQRLDELEVMWRARRRPGQLAK